METGLNEVLVVEDDELVRHGMARVLAGAGYRVSATGDLAEAIGWVEVRPFRVIVSDVLLPGPLHLADLARMALVRAIPLILASGLVRIERLGARWMVADVLAKPFSGDELLAAVRRGLAGVRLYGSEAVPGDAGGSSDDGRLSTTDFSSAFEWTPSLA